MQQAQPQHEPGTRCEVEIHHSPTDSDDWYPGWTVIRTRAADHGESLPYRVDLQHDDGRFIAGASPDCVRPEHAA